MPWQCFMVEDLGYSQNENGEVSWRKFRLADGSEVLWNDLKPGAMWWSRYSGEPDELCIKLPGGNVGNEFNMDLGRHRNEGKMTKIHPAWQRTGEAPNITLTPSINWVGQYHGWLQNGILTDDCEGRTYGSI